MTEYPTLSNVPSEYFFWSSLFLHHSIVENLHLLACNDKWPQMADDKRGNCRKNYDHMTPCYHEMIFKQTGVSRFPTSKFLVQSQFSFSLKNHIFIFSEKLTFCELKCCFTSPKCLKKFLRHVQQPTSTAKKGDILCGTKFLREFNFADWQFFVLRELVFAIG